MNRVFMKRFFSIIMSFVFVVSAIGMITVEASKDTASPKVVSAYPKNKATQIATNVTIKLKMSEKIYKASTFKSIKLTGADKKTVLSNVTIKSNYLNIDPKNSLKSNYAYFLSVPAKAVRDSSGNLFKTTYKISFMTKKAIIVTPKPTLRPTATPTIAPTSTPTPTPTSTPTLLPTSTPIPTPTWDVSGTPAPQFLGRFDFSDTVGGPKADWPGSTIRARFNGTEVSVNLKAGYGENWFEVLIDNQRTTPIKVTNTTNTILLASGLTQGYHSVELVKRTEGNQGPVQFKGFAFGLGQLLPPGPLSNRRIEFIGDSITCGYGNEGTDPALHFTPKNENNYLAYGSITARALGAEQATVARSGVGILTLPPSNGAMIDFYSRALHSTNSANWNFNSWIPQVVVINLCTNDFGSTLPDRATFTTAYTVLVNKVRSNYPDAHIYCAIGPMLNATKIAFGKECIQPVVNEKITQGDTKVHFLEFPAQISANGFGEDYHPSLKTHALMATQLTQTIKTDLSW